jgi:uncharacterized protein
MFSVKNTNKLIPLMMLAMFMLLAAPLMAAEGGAKMKVVYHINTDDPKTQAAALGNIQNHINAVGAENLDLRVVMHGDGLSLLIYPDALAKLTKFKHANATDTMTARIDGLKSQGVKFEICGNTVKGRNVDLASDLYDADPADVVPSGVAELANLQYQGFAYIKP